jgi:hypothetical protein
MRWTAPDEGRHDDAPGTESWGFELGGPRASGRIRLTLDVAHGRAGFVADLLLGSTGRIVVADESVAVPRPQAGLEIRADGLWASLYCETAFEHWSVGLEAFGLRLDGEDEDEDAIGGAGPAAGGSWETLVGERIPVGVDLEWELQGPPEPLPEGAGYAQPGVMFGEVLVVRDRIEVEVPAVRDHWWGGAPGVRIAQTVLPDA